MNLQKNSDDMKEDKENNNGQHFTMLDIHRPALTLSDVKDQCGIVDTKQPCSNILQPLRQRFLDHCNCSSEKLLLEVKRKLPIVDWLAGYDFKNWLLGDIISGVTVAIMHIPQGMGFALLAGIPAICGIYMAFFPVVIYALFGTGRHVSMGSFAVITLMTGKLVKELASSPEDQLIRESNGSIAVLESDSAAQEPLYTPIQVACVVTFMAGIWEIVLGVLQLGTLSVFLSDMLVSGFTTAAAVHVLTSQVKDLLGIKIPTFTGQFKIIYTYSAIFNSLSSANVAAVVISAITITVLTINNEILKERVARISRIPIPIELLVVIIGTISSYYGSLPETFDVHIVGDIPTGLPPPVLPPLELLSKVAVDSLVIAIVAYTVSFSLAKIFASRHGYTVDATQELYAQGLSNVFSSFFACAPMAASLARSLVQEAAGGVTQLASLVCCVVMVLVLLFVGPVFESLPKAVLASVIVVALKGMFLQVKDMIAVWWVSRADAMIWIVTFFSVVLIDIDIGLLIGVVFSLVVLLARNQTSDANKLGRLPDTDIYLDVDKYSQVREIPGVCIFRTYGPIHFANREGFRKSLISVTGFDPAAFCEANHKESPVAKKRWLVIDGSSISYIDSAGGQFLEQLRKEYEKVDIHLCLAGLSDTVAKTLEKNGTLRNFPNHHVFYSVHDAVAVIAGTYQRHLTSQTESTDITQM